MARKPEKKKEVMKKKVEERKSAISYKKALVLCDCRWEEEEWARGGKGMGKNGQGPKNSSRQLCSAVT